MAYIVLLINDNVQEYRRAPLGAACNNEER